MSEYEYYIDQNLVEVLPEGEEYYNNPDEFSDVIVENTYNEYFPVS